MQQVQIKTSWWFGKFSPEHLRVGISRSVPRNQPGGYRLMKSLAPGPWFNSVSAEEYRQRFFDEILGVLDPAKVVADLAEMAEGRTAVLLCFESPAKPQDWCHRAYVSAWLHDKLGLEVTELGLEQQGFGWHHPKLPANQRASGGPCAFDLSPFIGKNMRDAQGREWTVIEADKFDPSQIVVECGPLRKTVDQKVVLARLAA